MVDLGEKEKFYFDENIACIEKASNPIYLYSNVLTLMLNRMLKLFLQILKHRLPVEPDLNQSFKQVSLRKSQLTKGYAQTKRRITLIEKELRKVELEREISKSIQS